VPVCDAVWLGVPDALGVVLRLNVMDCEGDALGLGDEVWVGVGEQRVLAPVMRMPPYRAVVAQESPPSSDKMDAVGTARPRAGTPPSLSPPGPFWAGHHDTLTPAAPPVSLSACGGREYVGGAALRQFTQRPNAQ